MAGGEVDGDSPLAVLSSVIAIFTFVVSLFIAINGRLDHWEAIERDFEDFSREFIMQLQERDALWSAYYKKHWPTSPADKAKENQLHFARQRLWDSLSNIRREGFIRPKYAPVENEDDVGEEKLWFGKRWVRSYKTAKRWEAFKNRACRIKNDQDRRWADAQMKQLMYIGERLDEQQVQLEGLVKALVVTSPEAGTEAQEGISATGLEEVVDESRKETNAMNVQINSGMPAAVDELETRRAEVRPTAGAAEKDQSARSRSRSPTEKAVEK